MQALRFRPPSLPLPVTWSESPAVFPATSLLFGPSQRSPSSRLSATSCALTRSMSCLGERSKPDERARE